MYRFSYHRYFIQLDEILLCLISRMNMKWSGCAIALSKENSFEKCAFEKSKNN